MIIKSDGEGAYLSGDLAYYLDKRERGFDRCFIMLGADHHGYVGRMMAMCAAFGDEPGKNLEILIGQMVNLLRDGAAAADVQAGRHRRHHRRPGRGDRRRRRALRPDALQLGLQHRPRPRPVGEPVQRQPGLLRAVRPRPHLPDDGATRPTSACRCRAATDFDPALLSHEKEGDLLRALAEFPRVVASAAELREPHRVARYLEDTTAVFNRWYDTRECRMLPQGDEPVAADQRGAPGARSLPPARCSPTASACSASPPPSGCDGR